MAKKVKAKEGIKNIALNLPRNLAERMDAFIAEKKKTEAGLNRTVFIIRAIMEELKKHGR